MDSRLIIASAAFFETDELARVLTSAHVVFTRVEVGIGALNSAAQAARLKSLVAGRAVIFCGTGGVFGPFEGPAAFSAVRCIFKPRDVRSGESYLVQGTAPPLELKPISDFSECVAICSSTISKCPERIDHETTHLETLELYSVASTWLNAAQSFSTFLVSTNCIGPHAHEQWQKNFKAAAQLTADSLAPKIIRCFEQGKPWIF